MPDSSNMPNSYNQNHQIDDLIGVPPNWLLRSGITIVAIVFVIVLLLSAFIKYPDKIVAKGIMTSESPPIEHLSVSSGVIEEIFVQNGDQVSKNEPLLYIKNNTVKEDVKSIESFIEKYKVVEDIPEYLSLDFPYGLQLGEMQSEYGQLQLLFSQYQQTLRQTGVFQQIKTLQNEIEDTRALRKILIAEKDYSKDELALIERDFLRQVELNKEGVVSDLDQERVAAEWLRYQKQHRNLDQGIIQNKIREEQLILETQKLKEERSAKVQSHGYSIAEAINSLQSSIVEWQRKYFIKAELNGEVSFIPNLVEDKFVSQGTLLLAIIPDNNSNKKQIQALISNDGIGKINIGDKVIVKINGYPYKEFGVIISKVTAISELPEVVQNSDGENSYMYSLHIGLPDKLVTNHGKEILYRPNSSVISEIVTKDKSILERLFETFLSLLNQ